MTEHEHNYTLYKDNNITYMLCICGVSVKATFKGAVLVEEEVDQ